MLLEGADSIVLIEYTDKMDDTTILVNKPVSFGENVLDEDVGLGETILKSGTLFQTYSISILASLGIIKVPVVCKPKVGVISTGDEIISPEEYPKPGQIRDINSYLLYSSVIEYGGIPKGYGIVKDNYEALKETLKNAVSECVIVIINAGCS